MYEQELKLTAPGPQVLEDIVSSDTVQRHALRDPSGPFRFLALYYDTPNADFEANRYALRARREGNLFRAAFKMPGEIIDGMSRRVEYECDIGQWLECIDDLPASDLKDKVLSVARKEDALVEVVTVDMRRTILDLDLGGTLVELVTDAGTISAGGKKVNLWEVELELKSGELNEIVKLGSKIRSQFDLWPSKKTKYEIGLDMRKNS